MPTVEEYTDPFLRSYTYVPPTGPGICEVCHVVVDGTWTRCWSCNQTHLQVSRPVRLVVSISLYDIPGPLHTVLRKYKDGWSESVREPLGMQVSATLGRFLRSHESCLAHGDAFEMVTIVPSRKRAHPHPLESAVGRVRSLADRFERTLEPGSVEVGHNRASDRGFDVVADVRGLRVLLVDDTFTSGGALQSAASALYLAGADDVAAVVVGRVFKPDYTDTTRAFWAAVSEQDFSFDRCCLELDRTWVWPPLP